jgi:hypothetical protein
MPAIGPNEDALDTSGLFPWDARPPSRAGYAPPARSDVVWSNATGSVSGGGLVAEYCCAGAYSAVFANRSVKSGRHYWELTLAAAPGAQRAQTWTNAGVTTSAPGTNAMAERYRLRVSAGQGEPGSVTAFAQGAQAQLSNGDILMLALDADRRLAWFGLNGAWTNGVPGESGGTPIDSSVDGYSAYVTLSSPSASSGRLGDRWVANFGSHAFRYPIPPTYTAYGARAASPSVTDKTIADTFSGASFTDHVTLGERLIPLPEGHWIGLARLRGTRDADAAVVLGRIENQRLVGLLAARVAARGSALRTDCRREGAWHFESEQVGTAAGCWWIRQASSFLRDQPLFAAAGTRAQELGVTIPAAFINVAFSRDDREGGVRAYYYYEIASPIPDATSIQAPSLAGQDSVMEHNLPGLRSWGRNWAQIFFKSRS